jgi:hypothetical protein
VVSSGTKVATTATRGSARPCYQAFDLTIDLVRSLREPLARIAARDADLEKQLRRAASSVALEPRRGSASFRPR